MTELERDASKLTSLLEKVGEEASYQALCKMKDEDKIVYKDKLDYFKSVNENESNKNIRGKALEDLVNFLLEVSGGLFEVKCNVRTNTNELDQIIKISSKGKWLYAHKYLNERLGMFIGECKNYNKKVSVTYVGKFCSLLQTSDIKLGIIFSYHGVSGSGWKDGNGLIKKFYMCKEKESERICIIEFTYDDFEKILNGNNLLRLIDDKIDALRFDTSLNNLISKHPAEDEMKNMKIE